MPLRVWSAVSYLTAVDQSWRAQDWTANRIIKAVKGEPFNGYFEVKLGDRMRRFTKDNASEFLPPLFRIIAAKLATLVDGDFDLIPLPNSTATIDDEDDFTTLRHARAIVAAVGQRARVVPALRWRNEKIPAHKGGSRDPDVHFENLVVVNEPQNPFVLFDDVVTTGSQMVGAYRRLTGSAFFPTGVGLVIGRTTHEQEEKMIEWKEKPIETEEISLDWGEDF